MDAVIQIFGQHPSYPSMLTDTTGIRRILFFRLDRDIRHVGIIQTCPPHDGYDGYDGFFKSCPRARIFKSHFYLLVGRHFWSRYYFIGINNDSSFNLNRKDINVKKQILILAIGFMAVTSVHAQQAVVVERPGVLTDLASAVAAILALPFVAAEGVVVGTAEAAGSLVHGSTTVVVTTPAVRVPAPVVVKPAVVVAPPPAIVPSTTIVTTHGDGTVTTVTRQASVYELGPVIVAPVDSNHRVGASPYVNPYVYRPR